MASSINEAFFYDQVRVRLFDGKLAPKQRSGLATILAEWSTKHGARDDRWLAYMLATAHHETGRTMQPIKEWGGRTWYIKMYDIEGARPAVAKRLGNLDPGDGEKYPGRGYVQLTGKNNYARWAKRLGVDLVKDPDLALQPKWAVRILFEGMIDGSFTGKKLQDYLHGNIGDWRNARRIINGTDRADLVADYAKRYYGAISYMT